MKPELSVLHPLLRKQLIGYARSCIAKQNGYAGIVCAGPMCENMAVWEHFFCSETCRNNYLRGALREVEQEPHKEHLEWLKRFCDKK